MKSCATLHLKLLRLSEYFCVNLADHDSQYFFVLGSHLRSSELLTPLHLVKFVFVVLGFTVAEGRVVGGFLFYFLRKIQ